jgi:hypothetical protein
VKLASFGIPMSLECLAVFRADVDEHVSGSFGVSLVNFCARLRLFLSTGGLGEDLPPTGSISGAGAEPGPPNAEAPAEGAAVVAASQLAAEHVQQCGICLVSSEDSVQHCLFRLCGLLQNSPSQSKAGLQAR